jgi:hypothetical protein
MMRKKYFGEEAVFAFVWDTADADGMWEGDDATIAAEFGVTDDEAYSVLSELCDRNRVQKLGGAKYIITRWRDRDERAEEELPL